MNKEFIPYEEALALKELGFNELTFGYFYEDGTFKDEPIKRLGEKGFPLILAPLYQQAFRWFREKHNLTTHIKWNVGGVWDYTVEKSVPRGMLDMSPSRYMVGLETYEQAELTCLRKLIEIVKNKENENNNQ